MNKYQQTIETFDAVAEQYWQKFKDFKLYQPSYDWFCDYLPQHPPQNQVDLLEIACGPGNVSHYLLKKNPSIKLCGIDLAPKMVALAKKHNPQAQYSLLDCRQILSLNQTFDAIMCGFCIPYISEHDYQKLIKDMAAMLNPSGVLYLSTTLGSQSEEGFKGSSSANGAVYVHYHALDDILNCLTHHGLQIIGHKNLIHRHNEQSTEDVFILAKKQQDSKTSTEQVRS